METLEITLAERGQIVIPKEARDALGLKPGSKLQLRIEDSRLLIEKKVHLDLSRWVGKGVDDGLTCPGANRNTRQKRTVEGQQDSASLETAVEPRKSS